MHRRFPLKTLSFVVLQALACGAHAAPISLSGDYIRIGTNDLSGTLGSGGNTSPGILFDPSGTGTFGGADYLTPGTPMNGYGISSNLGTQVRNNALGGSNVTTDWTTNSFTDHSGAAFGGSTYDKRVVWNGTYSNGGNGYTVSHDIAFNNTDKWVRVRTTITATSNLTGLKFAKFTDPDVVAAAGDSSSTINTRGATLGGSTVSGNDLVKSTATASGYVIGYYSNSDVDHSTGISPAWSTDPNVYANGASGDTTGDHVIGIGFDVGTLSAGESVTLDYYYLFGTDLADLINSLNNSGGGGAPLPKPKLAAHAGTIGRGAAKVLDALDGKASTNSAMQALIDELNAMTDTQIRATLKTLSPVTNRATHTSLRQAMGAGFDAVRTRLGNLRFHGGEYRANSAPVQVAALGLPSGLMNEDTEYGVWTKAVATRSRQSSSADFNGYRSETTGVMFGADAVLESRWLIGAALSYGSTSVDHRRVSSATETGVDNYQFTAYASKWLGRSYADLMFAYAYHRFDSSRDTGIGGVADARFNGHHVGTKGEWGLPIQLDASTELTPVVGLTVSRLRTEGYEEKGAGPASLDVESSSATRVRSSVGVQLEKNLRVNGETLRPSLELSWLHDFRAKGVDTSAAFIGGGASFETPGQELERDAFGIGAGLSWQMAKDAVLSVNYNGEISNGYRSDQAELTAVWMF